MWPVIRGIVNERSMEMYIYLEYGHLVMRVHPRIIIIVADHDWDSFLSINFLPHRRLLTIIIVDIQIYQHILTRRYYTTIGPRRYQFFT